MNNSIPTPWYQVPTAWLVLGIPVVAVILGFSMLFVAIASYDGLVVDDYYRRGKEINLDLARDRLAAAQGRSASIAVTARELHVDLYPQTASSPKQIDVQLLHATRQGHDQHLSLTRIPDGRYHATLTNLHPGRYNIQLGADGWRLLGSVTFPGDTRIELSAKAD